MEAGIYLGLDSLIELFSETAFLIIFWTHFLAINLFCGSWIVSDSRKFSISKILIFIPLISIMDFLLFYNITC